MEKGTKISEPVEITVGVRKGKEYFVTDKDGVRRVVTVVVKGRVIQLLAAGEKKEQLTTKECDTFLTSLILKAPPKVDPKKDAEKKDADKKDAEKKDAPKGNATEKP